MKKFKARTIAFILTIAVIFETVDTQVYATESIQEEKQQILTTDPSSGESDGTTEDTVATDDEEVDTGIEDTQEPSSEVAEEEQAEEESEVTPSTGADSEQQNDDTIVDDSSNPEELEDLSDEDLDDESGEAIEEFEEEEQELLNEVAEEDTYTVSSDGTLTEFIPGSNFNGTVEIPEGAEAISVNCFSGLDSSVKAQITTVIFPESLTSIPDETFAGCSNLANLDFRSTSTISVTGKAFRDCQIKDIKLAEGITNIPTKFMSEAGYGANSTIHIPASVKTISKSAFEAYGTTYTIANIDFAEGSQLRSIATDAFQNCTSITSITFPASLSGIGSYAFLGCTNLATVDFADGSNLATIGYEAFYNCSSLTAIEIPESVTKIYDEAFRNAGLTTLVVNSTKLSSQYNYIFTGCELSSVTLPEGMKTVPRIFYHAGFASGTTVIIPASVTKIDDYAFNSSNIYGIEFAGDSVTSIGTCAFEDCSSLSNITLPSKLKTLGTGAFKGCSSIQTVVIPNTITSIPSRAFESCSGITSLTIGTKVSSIGAYGFYGCSGLTELTIPDNVKSIGKYAFNRCTGLRTLKVSANVTSLPYRSLGYLTSLSELYLGNNISSVVNNQEYALEGTDQASLNIYVTSTSSKTYKALKVAVSKDWLLQDQIMATTKLSYQLNGGTAVGTYPSSYVSDANSSSNIMLHHPVRDGYVFAGWYLDAKYKTAIGRNYDAYSYIPISQLTGKTKLYAKWVGPTFYDVTLDAAGGTVEYSTIRVALKGTFGEHDTLTSFGLPTVTPPTGKNFLGWYSEDKELVTDSTVVTAAADGQTLTAMYSSKTDSVEAPVVNAVGYDSITDGDSFEKGVKLYFTSATAGADITYSITDSSSNVYKEGTYSSNVSISEAGTYSISATASKDGKDSNTIALSITVEDDTTPNGYTDDKANTIWLQYKNTAEWDETSVSAVYTGSAIKYLVGESYDYVVYYGKNPLTEGKDYTISYANNTKVANYDATNAKGASIAPTLKIKGKGSISGTVSYRFSITSQDAEAIRLTTKNTTISLDSNNIIYDGSSKEPGITIEYKGTKAMVPNTEYTVVYTNNVKAGNASATITFDGTNYYGTIVKKFKINKLNMNQANTSGGAAIQIDKGDAVTYSKSDMSALTSIKIVSSDKTLVENTDYTKKITTKTDKNTGIITATMKITGKGNLTGSTSFTYTVNKADISSVDVTNVLSPVYSGRKNVYKPTNYAVMDGSSKLKLNTDYLVASDAFEVMEPSETTYTSANAKTVYPAGTSVRMTITGKGYYNGTKVVEYTIADSYDFTDSNIFDISVSNVNYQNKANICRPKIVVKNLYAGKTMNYKAYTVANYRYANETVISRKVKKKVVYEVVPAGTAVDKTDIIPAGTYIYVDISGNGSYVGTVTCKFKYIYNMSSASAKVINQTYTGKPVVPEKSDITVKFGKEVLSANDYEIVSCTNNTKAGTAKITIKGNGAYTGTKTVKYKIVAKKL